jgi:hypothetical protein
MFALIIVFLESLGSLHVFAILSNILLVGDSRKSSMVTVFLKFQVAAGDKSCFYFSTKYGFL